MNEKVNNQINKIYSDKRQRCKKIFWQPSSQLESTRARRISAIFVVVLRTDAIWDARYKSNKIRYLTLCLFWWRKIERLLDAWGRISIEEQRNRETETEGA